MVSKIAFLYLSYLAWGCLVLLPVVKLQEVGQGFYRFFGFTCVTLQTLAMGLALMMGPSNVFTSPSAVWALGVSLFLTLCFTVALRVRMRLLLWSCFAGAVLSGLLAIGVLPWFSVYDFGWVLLSIHAFLSALVLGAGILAMMLGHWYLVTPKLSIIPLKRYAGSYILLTVFILLELGLVYFFDLGSGKPDDMRPFLFRQEIIFVLFRVVWGVLAPLGMSYWIWTTVKMKSTQSATGILYASMVCTMVGEAFGLYLTLRTGVPF